MLGSMGALLFCEARKTAFKRGLEILLTTKCTKVFTKGTKRIQIQLLSIEEQPRHGEIQKKKRELVVNLYLTRSTTL